MHPSRLPGPSAPFSPHKFSHIFPPTRPHSIITLFHTITTSTHQLTNRQQSNLTSNTIKSQSQLFSTQLRPNPFTSPVANSPKYPLYTFTKRTIFGKKEPKLTPDQARKAKDLYESPFKRAEASRRIKSLDEIPDDTEELTMAIAAKPKKNKEEVNEFIRETRRRVDESITQHNLFSRNAGFAFMVMAGVSLWLWGNWRANKVKGLTLDQKMDILAATAPHILDTAFHDCLHQTLDTLLENSFRRSIHKLHLEGNSVRQELLYAGSLIPWRPEAEVAAEYDSQILVRGVRSLRVDPPSQVWADYDESLPEVGEDDPERFLEIPLFQAQELLQLYLSIIIMHLDSNMSMPVFRFLYNPASEKQSGVTLTEGKDHIWSFFKADLQAAAIDCINLVQSEALYEGLRRPDGDKMTWKSPKPTTITLRGLRNVATTIHYRLFATLKNSVAQSALQMYQTAEKAVEDKKFKGKLPSKLDYCYQFPQLVPTEFSNTVLRYPLMAHDGGQYYQLALADQVRIMRGQNWLLADQIAHLNFGATPGSSFGQIDNDDDEKSKSDSLLLNGLFHDDDVSQDDDDEWYKKNVA